MTVNYYIKCPACSKITRMRSPAGYIYITPVRVHCYDCDTLLTGNFISNNKTIKAYFSPTNCTQVYNSDYDFYGETSGELVIHKVCNKSQVKDKIIPFDSPAMIFLNNVEMESANHLINYARHIEALKENWDKINIKYNLFLNGKYDLVIKVFSEDAKKWGINLKNSYDIQNYINNEYNFDFGGIFGKNNMFKRYRKINYEITHLNKTQLKNYTKYLIDSGRITVVQKKLLKIMEEYVKVSLYTLPALFFSEYRDNIKITKCDYGLSTCTLEDIKKFYLDSYESILSSIDIIKCLDNIIYRGNYESFDTKHTLKTFCENTTNGNKIKLLSKDENFSKMFKFSESSSILRNALTHNEYKYIGSDQKVEYTQKKDNIIISHQKYLIDIAIECNELMKYSMLMEFIINTILRLGNKNKMTLNHLHPYMYKGLNSQSSCPCGSEKKYRTCCKNWVKENKKKIKSFELKNN